MGSPSSVRTSQKPKLQKTGSKTSKNEELVKLMSKLPSYLERGENLQVKAFNVGVLDWRGLEKWHYNHKQILNRSNRYSPSSSDTLSFFSTDESSNCSSRGHSCSPTLLSHLNSSHKEGYSQCVKYSPGYVDKFQDPKGVPSVLGAYHSFAVNPSDIKVKEPKTKNLGLQSITERKTYRDLESSGLTSSSKGKVKIQEGECAMETGKLQEVCYSIIQDDYPNRRHTQTVVPHFPSDGHDNSRAEFSHPFDATDMNGKKSPSSPPSAKISISPSRRRIVKEKRSTLLPTNSTAEATKVRNPSPTRRFINGLGRIGKNSTSNESEVSASLDHSTTNKPNTTSTDRSSPLRRLSNPLLKPKASSCDQFVELPQKGSASTNRTRKSSDGRGDSSILHSVLKVTSDMKSYKKNDAGDGKRGSSKRQAYLHIAMKNGLPLFTFVVENSSDVLTATVRLISPKREDKTRIYTFFTVGEKKKENGKWLNQGDKGESCGYIPNVVAQMKVSDPPYHSMDQFSIREFVLFAVDLRPLNQQNNLQENNELVAIVVKFPIGYSQNEEKGLFVGTRDLFSTTVILPSGVHGISSKGEPSPLIERWVSGGLCDCGGWDLGCRVRVLANQTPPSRKLSSAKAHQPTGQFELFSKGEVLNNRPVFSLSSFKNGIFSVEFNSSLSLLQAFSICVAVLECTKSSGLSKLSDLMEEKLSEESILSENDRVKIPLK